MLATTAVLVPVTMTLFPLHVAGWFYLAVAILLGAAFLAIQVWGVLKRLGGGWARKSFFFSLVYLAVLFAALFLLSLIHI